MHARSEKFGFAPSSGARDNNEVAAFLWNLQAKVKSVWYDFFSDYLKIFDGNGTEVFARHGLESTSPNKSLQQVPFEESKNITIQVSLADLSSRVKIDYGVLKEPLTLGRVNKFAVVCSYFAFVMKSGIPVVSYVPFWQTKIESGNADLYDMYLDHGKISTL